MDIEIVIKQNNNKIKYPTTLEKLPSLLKTLENKVPTGEFTFGWKTTTNKPLGNYGITTNTKYKSSNKPILASIITDCLNRKHQHSQVVE